MTPRTWRTNTAMTNTNGLTSLRATFLAYLGLAALGIAGWLSFIYLAVRLARFAWVT
jgi:hypothetical protein